ncbi:hypothetical protein PAMP_020763 [Pampus punctatissimus]
MYTNMYFCKGVCSGENILIQTERKTSAIMRRGRYSMEVSREDGVFNVTIKRLKKVDAGAYHCGVEENLKVLYHEVNLKVLDASTVSPGSPSSTTTPQNETETLSQSNFLPSTVLSPATVTPPATDEKKKHKAVRNLTDTTVVIIVSVSLALLVCAIIPLIFYGHWRSSAVSDGQNGTDANKGEGDYAVVRLQSLEPDADPESSTQDASQYAAIYQALDPQTLE